MNTLFFGKDLEERKEMIIALLVIALFGWLGYKMGWLNTETEASPNEIKEQAITVSADIDNDGINNDKDSCPLVPGLAANKGCPTDGGGISNDNDQRPNASGLKIDNSYSVGSPAKQKIVETVSTIKSTPTSIDSDGDGVFDSADQCPNTAGTIKGCPADTDSDGISDDEDRCIDIVGTVQNSGCPVVDSDKDGIEDAVDQCPNQTGIAENNGCPLDSDNDSVANTEDKCPNKAGSTENNGCPVDVDTDNDGIIDTKDECPDKAGIGQNNGCPEPKITEEERKVIDEAISSVKFITGSSKLTKYSKGLLDKVVTLLVSHPDYNLLIRGHTDSIGDNTLNFKLSKARALSVYTYLASKGIVENRMSHNGFGERQPVASNDTKNGRLKNRRVELKLFY